MVKKGKIITGWDEIVYHTINNLSYSDTNEKFVALYVLDKFVGNTKVYWDECLEDRQYIVVNNVMFYLDEITRKKLKNSGLFIWLYQNLVVPLFSKRK